MLWMFLQFILGVMPIADKPIVWWRTPGALVLQGDTTCSMVFTENRDMAVISWDKQTVESVAFIAPEPIHDSTALVRLDTTIIGETNLTANGIAILLTPRPLDDLLSEATQISADIPEHPFIIPINHSKMPILMTARDRCRAALR